MSPGYRQTLLQCLKQHGEQIVDELLTRLDVTDRKQLMNNINAAMQEGLVMRRRDDVTGLPSYSITEEGKKRLESVRRTTEKKSSVATTAQQPQPEVGNNTGTIGRELSCETPLRGDDGGKAGKDCVEVAHTSQPTPTELELEKDVAELSQALAEATQRLADAETAIDLLKQMSEHTGQTPIGYLVKTPGRRPVLRSDAEKAKQVALYAARRHGRSDVLALLPVGRAERSSNWVEQSV